MRYFSWNDGFAYTSPAASFRANAFGLYDMIGNAWQWCQDLHPDPKAHDDYDKKAVTDPTGPVSLRVQRRIVERRVGNLPLRESRVESARCSIRGVWIPNRSC